MKAILPVYRFLNLLSVDVACGAVVCAAFFAQILQVSLRTEGLASLGISVWIIYSVDHLMDAHFLKKPASTKRHQLHQENFKLLAACVAMAFVIDLVLIFYIRRPVLIGGIGLAFIVGLYLVLHRFLHPFKELIAGMLYAGGVLLLPLSLHSGAIELPVKLMMIIFANTALINLVLFSWFDHEQDLNDTHRSLVTLLGKRNTGQLLKFLMAVQIILIFFTIALFSMQNGIELIILFSMNAVLCILFIFPSRFIADDNYRLAGDFIFFLPLIFILGHG